MYGATGAPGSDGFCLCTRQAGEVADVSVQTYLCRRICASVRERFGVELDDSLSEVKLRVVDEELVRTRTLDEIAHRYDVFFS
jgi:hypothetical protein